MCPDLFKGGTRLLLLYRCPVTVRIVAHYTTGFNVETRDLVTFTPHRGSTADSSSFTIWATLLITPDDYDTLSDSEYSIRVSAAHLMIDAGIISNIVSVCC